jgi:hypothetical protein
MPYLSYPKLAQVMVAMFVYKLPQLLLCHLSKKPMREKF